MEKVGQKGLHVTFLLIALVSLAAIPQAVLARGPDSAASVSRSQPPESSGPNLRFDRLSAADGLSYSLTTAIAAQGPQTPENLPPSSIRFERISIAEGLSFSVVETILQDRQGFLWVGTERGLKKYDGYQFTVYRNDPADPRSLSRDRITTLYEDGAGQLWVGTEAGLDRLDRTTGTFVHYQDGLKQAWVYAIYEDRRGVLWVGSSAGLYQLNRDSQAFTLSSFRREVTTIAEDVDGRLWVGSYGVYLHDPETNQARLAGLGGQWIRTIHFGYGYGWLMGEDRGRPVVGGAGWNAGFATLYARYPEDGLTLIALMKQGDINHFSVWGAITSKLFGEPPPTPAPGTEWVPLMAVLPECD